MSRDNNIGLARRYYEECPPDDGDPDKKRALRAVDELFAEGFVMYFNSATDAEAMRGSQAHKDFLLEHTRLFPGERWTIEAIVADDQTVACHWHVRATDAETGNPIDVQAADFFTVQAGRLAALRRFLDFEDLAAQRSGASPEQQVGA